MDNPEQTEQTKIRGLTNTGSIPAEPDAGVIDDIRSQLLKLSVMSNLSLRLAAIDIGMGEHNDDMINNLCVHIVGCSIFADALETVGTNDIQPNTNLIKAIASECQHEFVMVKERVDSVVGFSTKSKNRFVNQLKEFLNGSIGKNIQGFTVGVANIIR